MVSDVLCRSTRLLQAGPVACHKAEPKGMANTAAKALALQVRWRGHVIGTVFVDSGKGTCLVWLESALSKGGMADRCCFGTDSGIVSLRIGWHA